MKRTLLRAALYGAAMTAVPLAAFAQPTPRDHRHDPAPPPAPPPAPEPRDHRHDPKGGAVRIDRFEPGSAGVGATVTIKGDNFPADAVVYVNGQRAVANRTDEHTLSFAVPQLPAGKFRVEVDSRGHRDAAGELEVLPSGSPPIVPPRDHGGPDHDHDHDGRPDNGRPPANPPPPPPMPPPHEWHIDRPTISSFWPAKGEVGTGIVVRGVNFAPDTKVMWGDQVIAAVRVTPTQLDFKVPRGAPSGLITIQSGGMRRPLPVGNFEVTRFDAAAEYRRMDDERRARAEAAWQSQQAEWAKFARDRAAREAEIARQERELEGSRAARRAQIAAAMRARFQAAFLNDDETRGELALHAQRIAEIDRMTRIAKSLGEGKLVVRIEIVGDKENTRHEERMAALEASFRAGGGR